MKSAIFIVFAFPELICGSLDQTARLTGIRNQFHPNAILCGFEGSGSDAIFGSVREFEVSVWIRLQMRTAQHLPPDLCV